MHMFSFVFELQVGSTPVRRWKQDLGLYGARNKDAGLSLARLLFPSQARILKWVVCPANQGG